MPEPALPHTPPGSGQGVHGAGVRDGGNGGNTPLPGTQQQAPDFKTQRGTSGDDSLYGGDGKDHLYGEADKDWLYGGDGSDRFVFGAGDGTDTIRDFEDGTDILVIKGGLKFSDLAITNNAKGHAVITGYGENDSITLKGVSASILTDADFDFLGG